VPEVVGDLVDRATLVFDERFTPPDQHGRSERAKNDTGTEGAAQETGPALAVATGAPWT
jgi:hypothetical protein